MASDLDELCATLTLTPHGRLVFAAPGGAPEMDAPRARILARAFARGAGHGLLRLGAAEVGRALPPDLAYWREFAGRYVTAVCLRPDAGERGGGIPPPPEADWEALAAAAPAMPGAEYLGPTLLRALWRELDDAFGTELARSRATVQDFLKNLNPAWNVVGRVHFNLAENRGDDQAPFAFMATYTSRLSSHGKAQHVPLGQALREYAGAANKERLLSLLLPVQRAAESCAWLRQMVDSGEIFHPLRWSPQEAFRFLGDVPELERAGVVVRMPATWSAGRPPRPQVTATVGAKPPARFGKDALLEFSMEVTLDGERLTPAEVQEILAGTSRLALIRGRWVEVDSENLARTMARFREAERRASLDGLPFTEAMRLLARADIVEDGGADRTLPDWSQVAAGPWLAETLRALRVPENLGSADPGEALRGTLRPYQQVGVRWLRLLSQLRLGACLADDMGLGKTIQVLALLLLQRPQLDTLRSPGDAKRPATAMRPVAAQRSGTTLRPRAPEPHGTARRAETTSRTEATRQPSLLVAPASLLANWVAEIERFAPSLAVVVAHPSAMPAGELKTLAAENLAAVDLVITSYGSLLRIPWLGNTAWDFVILDEAQAIKNPEAKQTRTVKKLEARTRVALTGTPIENRLGDLWSIFDFINPGLLGSAREFTQYTKRLAARSGSPYGPLRDLVRPYILRRLKTDKSVIADLPDKTEVKAYCQLSRKQAALYQQAVGELARQLERSDGIRRRGVVLAFLTRFKQICNHPSQWLGDGSWAEDDSGKWARLGELCEVIAAKQEKVLVFTQFREVTAPLAAFLRDVFGRPGLVLHGETAVGKRRGLVERFQEDESVPFFVLSLKVGGSGLNLTSASHVVHFDRWWNPAVENQATDRAFRIGQRQNVLVQKFVCRGTVEERIDDLIEAKKELSKELLEGGAELNLTELGDAELLKLVALDLDTAMEE